MFSLTMEGADEGLNIKGVSSMKLHRELGIGQKAAWFMLHRLRKAYEMEVGPFQGR